MLQKSPQFTPDDFHYVQTETYDFQSFAVAKNSGLDKLIDHAKIVANHFGLIKGALRMEKPVTIPQKAPTLQRQLKPLNLEVFTSFSMVLTGGVLIAFGAFGTEFLIIKVFATTSRTKIKQKELEYMINKIVGQLENMKGVTEEYRSKNMEILTEITAILEKIQ